MSRIEVRCLLITTAMCIVQCKHAITDKVIPAINSKQKPVQQFIYKCGDVVDEEFWVAPNRFHIQYDYKKVDFLLKSSFGFNFTLNKRIMDCEDTFLISTSIPYNTYTSGRNVTALTFSPDGYLTYNFDHGGIQDEVYYHKDRYCIQKITDDALTVRLCKSTCFHLPEEKGSEMCIPTCCPFGWIFDSETEQCKEVIEDWVPSVYVNRLASKPLLHWNGVMKYVPPSEIICYNDSKEIAIFPTNKVRLIANGKLVRRMHVNRGSKIRWADHTSAGGQPFCMDAYWNTSKSPHFQPSDVHMYVSRCLQTQTSGSEQRIAASGNWAYNLHSQISVPLIYLPCTLIYLAILIVYILLWEKQTSQGWTVMAFSASQFGLYLVLMIVVGMAIYSNVLVSDSMHYVCNALGIIYNFAYISTYSWTSVLTFDVWNKLSSMKQALQMSKGKKRFFYYSCFGVGVPTFIVTFASIMEWGLWEFPEDMVVMPGYSDFCVVNGSAAFLIYQGLPSAFLFAGNLAFLVLTFCSLWEAKKNVDILKKEDSAQSKQSSMDNKVVLIAKLMVMMGAFLIFEFTLNFGGLIQLSVWFTILQGFRILHAVGLFYLFVCSKKVKKQLQEQYPSLFTAPTVSAQIGRPHVGTETSVVSSTTVSGTRPNDSSSHGNYR